MPVYLLHGFRWPRPLIRIHIILQNLDDAAAEWLVAPGTTMTMRKNFSQLYPEAMEHLRKLRFVEQYDPNDTSADAASQPYAYVADIVHEVRLGVDVDEVRGQGVGNDQWAAMMELRDKLAPEEKVGWYIVVCGDEERWAPPTMGLLRDGGHEHNGMRRESETDSAYYSNKQSLEKKASSPTEGRFKKLFSKPRLGRRKSRMFDGESTESQSPSSPGQTPPLPHSTVDSKPPQLPRVASNNINGGTPISVTPDRSATPPARPRPRSVRESISPVREHFSTPNTEVSISPVRRDSNVTSSNSRGVSPVEVRRALGPLDRIRNQSPATRPVDAIVNGYANPQPPQSRNGNIYVNGHTRTDSQPHASSGMQQPLSSAQRLAKRLSLQPAAAPPPVIPPAKDQDDEYEEVISIAPATTAPVQMYRRSRASLVMTNGSTSHTTLDPVSVAEGANPAVYKPTNGDGHHDPHKFRAEQGDVKPAHDQPVFGQNLSNFDLIANNIENAFESMR